MAKPTGRWHVRKAFKRILAFVDELFQPRCTDRSITAALSRTEKGNARTLFQNTIKPANLPLYVSMSRNWIASVWRHWEDSLIDDGECQNTLPDLPGGYRELGGCRMTLATDERQRPKDGRAFIARIPGYGQDNVIRWIDGLIDAESNGVLWRRGRFADEQEPPDMLVGRSVLGTQMTDGVASARPTHWMPLPQPPEDK